MREAGRIRIGGQTSFAAAAIMAPFDYAVANGFDAFEWFPDRRPTGQGWLETDLSTGDRAVIRRTALDRDIALSVHGSWAASPMTDEGYHRLVSQAEFAADIGASIFVVHLDVSRGVSPFLDAIQPLLELLAAAGIRLAIENTVSTRPADFNDLFRAAEEPGKKRAGVCLDVGHANLCDDTRHDYLAFIDRLAANVTVSHVHLHENWGDGDSHLTLFTGPAGYDPSGVEGLVDRLLERGFSGAMILEQWPDPPALLAQARNRLVGLIAQSEARLFRRCEDPRAGESDGPEGCTPSGRAHSCPNHDR